MQFLQASIHAPASKTADLMFYMHACNILFHIDGSLLPACQMALQSEQQQQAQPLRWQPRSNSGKAEGFHSPQYEFLPDQAGVEPVAVSSL